ncbi:MAG: type II secretion system minor pseudopilin GspH [Pseudomonas sp.]
MRSVRGFTLIELLVVLVIIGCLVGLAVLSTGTASTSRELRDEAQRLAALIGLLADEAVLDNREYGLLVRADGYRVLRYDQGADRWAAIAGEAEHRLPAWARLELELDGEPLRLAAPVKEDEDEPGLTPAGAAAEKLPEPQLLILSSGELSPFRLRLAERRQPDNGYQLSSDGFQLPQAEPAKAGR